MSAALSLSPQVPDFRVFFLGDRALQVIADASPALPLLDLTPALQTLARHLRELPFVSAVICAFDSVTLLLQPQIDAQFALAQVQNTLNQELNLSAQSRTRTHKIEFSRALLASEFQGDLTAAAAHSKRSEHDWLTQFCATRFTVAMIGFKPGFPYLLGLPEQLAMPRLAKPRTAVAKGSVAVGGNFAGIYPTCSAGGWHVIGITNTVLFDLSANEPCLFAAGDTVQFAWQRD